MLRKYAKMVRRKLRPNRFRPLSRIELSRDAMLGNISMIQGQHPDFAIIPVLKGNAYGHGIEKVAEILNQTHCRLLAVDGYFEAAQVRDITNHHLLVMSYILPQNTRLLDLKRCSFVVQNIEGLHAFGALNKNVRVHLELNTGMNRLGLQPEELPAYLEVLRQYPRLTLEGVMTHLADADNERDESFDSRQLASFDTQVAYILSQGFKPELIHIAQTAGSVKVKSRFANAIRLGIGLYGINPLHSKDPHYADLALLKPVLELKSTIIKVLELQKGDRVSYNGTFTAPRKMRIGVLPLGYYDGVSRDLSNKGFATSQGKELPIVGRVCMDHIMISLEGADLGLHDEVTVISSDTSAKNSVAALQKHYGLFSYVTVTGLSSSIRRQII